MHTIPAYITTQIRMTYGTSTPPRIYIVIQMRMTGMTTPPPPTPY